MFPLFRGYFTGKEYLAISYGKKQTGVSFSCVCPVIDNEFCHNIVKVVCRSNLFIYLFIYLFIMQFINKRTGA